MQQQEEDDDERDDGDMCELENKDSNAVAEQREEAPSSEVKAALPVPAAVESPSEVSENQTSAATEVPAEKAEEKAAAV